MHWPAKLYLDGVDMEDTKFMTALAEIFVSGGDRENTIQNVTGCMLNVACVFLIACV